MNKNIDKKNFIWNLIGSMFLGFTSLFFMIIVTRVNGIEDAGIFTYGFALACVFFTIGSYSGKTYQITEMEEKFSDSDYIYSKFISFGLMMIISLFFCILMKYDLTKLTIIMVLTLYRGFDALIESLHAIIQRNGFLYKAGMSLFYKTIVLILLFLIINIIFKNLLLSCFTLVIINMLFCLFVDYRIAKKFIKINKFDKSINKELFKAGFYMFCFAFLASYVISVPRYFIDFLDNASYQAIFGIIIMPSTFLVLVAQYIVQPFLGNIVDHIKNSNFNKLINLVLKISGFIVLVGLCILVGTYLLGIPLLELIYGISLKGQLFNLIIIIIGSIIYSIVIVLSAVIVAMRKTFMQLVILIIDAGFAYLCCNILVNSFEIRGASLSYLLIMVVQLILYIGFLTFLIKKNKKLLLNTVGNK